MRAIMNLKEYDAIIDFSDGIVVVDFFTKSCLPCKEVKRHLERLEREVNVSVYTVDCEEHADIAEAYNICSVPTLIVYENGFLLNQHTGICDYNKIHDMVSE